MFGGKFELYDQMTNSPDALVDEFVRYLNQAGFEPGFSDSVPEELRTSEAEPGILAGPTIQLQSLDRRLYEKIIASTACSLSLTD